MGSKPNLVLFCDLIALLLGYNCVKSLRFTKIVKKVKLEGVWGEIEAKKCLRRQLFTKVFETSSTFQVKKRTTGKV